MTSREPIQVRVVIVEARALKGQEGESDLVNPAVRINLEAGPIKRSLRTNIFRDVSSVFFNETKVFQEVRLFVQEGRPIVEMLDELYEDLELEDLRQV